MNVITSYIVEIKELIKVYGIDDLAAILGKTPRGIQYWIAETDPKVPTPTTQRTIHELFVKHQAGENIKGLIEPDYKDKLIASQEREIKRLQKDLDLSLGELRHNILLARAMASTNQSLLIEILAKQKRVDLSVIVADANRLFDVFYKSMKEEGSFSYVGK